MKFVRDSVSRRRDYPHRRVRMRDMLVYALLPVVMGVYVIAASILDYSDAIQFDDWWSRRARLSAFLVNRLEGALHLTKSVALQRRLDPEAVDAGIIHLQVPPDQWQSWQRDPLASWGQWINANLMRGNSVQPVKIRKRGDTSVHWISEKKSFTLKTPRSSLFKGYRNLAFSTKTVLNSFLANRLASEFDLLAPFTTVTPCFVNKRFYGIYRATELIDESFLRTHGRMPGNIFRGDTAERGEYFSGVSRDLFANPYIWDRVAQNHESSAAAQSTLTALLLDLNGTTFDDHLRLMSWVDRDEIARLIALMLLLGDFDHMSDIHNNFWYEDPSSGVLHPIPWDLRLLAIERAQTSGYQFNRLLRELIRNPFVLDDALRALHKRLANDALFHTAERSMRNVYARYRDHFTYDDLGGPMTSPVGSPDEILSDLRRNIRLINDWFKKSEIAFHAEQQAAGPVILDFEARGYMGSDLLAIDVKGDGGLGQSIQLVADWNRNGILDESDRRLPAQWVSSKAGGRLILTTPQPLLPGVDTEQSGITPAPIHYRFFLTINAKRRRQVSVVGVDLRNRLTGDPATVLNWSEGKAVTSTPSWHPWQYPLPSSVVHRLSGHTHLRTTLVIPEGDTLVIDAGTTVWLHPDVSILARGRAVVRGSLKHPITFRPAIEGQPWGTIALQGAGASGSVFEHVRFIGGGGASLNRVNYTGMVSVHWADNVRFRHCELADNVRSDDALHAVHADVTVQNCSFLRSNGDAIDFDYSSGEISNSRFTDSGNDAIDLMTSAPRIVGNRITGSKDKGISIGEASRPFIFNNYIADSHRGIEIKDRSEPLLVNNVITHNTIGILQNVKNWRYGGGGWGKLVNTQVLDNGTDIKSDKDSRLTTVDSGVVANTPTPASTRADSSTSTDSTWIFAHYGIRPTSNSAGQVDDWTAIQATAPNVLGTFEDDFEQIADGWVPGGSASRLEKSISSLGKRDQDLQAIFSRRRGHISRSVNWNLTDPRYTYIAIFELTGRNLSDSRLSVLSTDSEVSRPFEVTGDLASYRYVSVELKPAHYTVIKIAADPGASTGRLHLHTYRLYAIPKADLAS